MLVVFLVGNNNSDDSDNRKIYKSLVSMSLSKDCKYKLDVKEQIIYTEDWQTPLLWNVGKTLDKKIFGEYDIESRVHQDLS